VARQVPARLSSDAEVRSLAASSLVKLFDSLYEGAVVIDHAGRITWINDKYKALIGWNGAEAIEGRAIEEVLPNSRLRQVVETGQADLLDVLTIGGRQMVVSRIPLHGEAGNVIGALGVILYDRLQGRLEASVFGEAVPLHKLYGVERRPLEIRLHVVAAQVLESRRHRVVGGTYGDDGKFQMVGEFNERSEDLLGSRFFGQVTHRRHIDLDFLKRHRRKPDQRSNGQVWIVYR
jgi:PAS domain-containing protein